MEVSHRSFASILIPEVRQNLGGVVLGFARAPLSLMSNQFSWIFGSGSVGIWDLLAPCWSRQSHPRNLDSQSSHILCRMVKRVCKCMNWGFSLRGWCQSLQLEETTYWGKKKCLWNHVVYSSIQGIRKRSLSGFRMDGKQVVANLSAPSLQHHHTLTIHIGAPCEYCSLFCSLS